MSGIIFPGGGGGGNHGSEYMREGFYLLLCMVW